MRADDRHGRAAGGSGDAPMPDRVRLTLRDRIILALMASAVAAVIGVVAAWITGDTSGIVADKREIQITECRDTCWLKTCHQVTYVTDDGHRRKLCLPKGRYDRVNLGDRISG